MHVKEYIYTGKVNTSTELEQLIQRCPLTDDTLFLGEALPRTVVKPAVRQELLRFVHATVPTDFNKYTSGRIFNHNFELRWEELDPWQKVSSNTEYHVIYIGTERNFSTGQSSHNDQENNTPYLKKQDTLLIFDQEQEHEFDQYRLPDDQAIDALLRKKTIQYYLFGKRDQARDKNVTDSLAFTTARIPRILGYPLKEEATRAQLSIYTYFSKRYSSITRWRCVGIRKAPEKEGKK